MTNSAESIEEGDMRVKLPFFLLHESKKDDHEVRVTREDACREGVTWEVDVEGLNERRRRKRVLERTNLLTSTEFEFDSKLQVDHSTYLIIS